MRQFLSCMKNDRLSALKQLSFLCTLWSERCNAIRIRCRTVSQQLRAMGVEVHHERVLEILSKAVHPNAPLEGQEFYEIRIDDSVDLWRTGYVVSQAHAQWSEIDRQVMWDETETERCLTYKSAKERYEARRRSLVEKGFIHSDMDF